MHRKRLEDRVCFTGYVPDEVLVEPIIRPISSSSIPEEGFSSPSRRPRGTPVVTSGARRESKGPAWAFPPNDVRALTDGLRDLLNDLARRRAMGDAGRERARSFSWEQAAAQTHTVLREVGRS